MEIQQVDRQPYFDPWIGQEYRETLRSLVSGDIRNGILDRVHLMGESHYSDEKLSPDWTTELIRRHGTREGPGIPFLTKVLQVMSQNEDGLVDRAEAWGQFAFSNFLQSPLEKPKQAVPADYWEEGRAAFFGQLAITRPTVLVCFGKRLFENLPDVGRRVPWNLAPNGEGDPIVDAWLYTYDTDHGPNATVAIWVYHPSARGWFGVAQARRRQIGARMFYSNIISALNDGSLFRDLDD